MPMPSLGELSELCTLIPRNIAEGSQRRRSPSPLVPACWLLCFKLTRGDCGAHVLAGAAMVASLAALFLAKGRKATDCPRRGRTRHCAFLNSWRQKYKSYPRGGATVQSESWACFASFTGVFVVRGGELLRKIAKQSGQRWRLYVRRRIARSARLI